jgi:hypothetical protein
MALITLVVVGLSIPLLQYWRADTLARLQQCRREIPSSGDQDFESPCVSMLWRRLGLAGISVTRVEAALGKSWCTDGYELSENAGCVGSARSRLGHLPIWRQVASVVGLVWSAYR